MLSPRVRGCVGGGVSLAKKKKEKRKALQKWIFGLEIERGNEMKRGCVVGKGVNVRNVRGGLVDGVREVG